MSTTNVNTNNNKQQSPPRKILVPTDFSEASSAALEYAVGLGKALGAPVHVVHAFELPIVGFPDGTLTITAEMASRIINAAQDALKGLVDDYAKNGTTLTTSLEQADPRDGILNAAEKEQCDLIVMGTHGRRGIARALIGSVAEATVRRSPIPVLTIHTPKTTQK
jgi:nucleotide-binding universal stress UspA family protein